MRILVLGSGGREHAIVHSLAESPSVDAIFAAPGNGGTAGERVTTNVALDPSDSSAVVAFAREQRHRPRRHRPGGPARARVSPTRCEPPVSRPSVRAAEGAQLEGSKSFAKSLMERARIPTARLPRPSLTVTSRSSTYVETVAAPLVVKADGLAAGKGVTVAETTAEALAAIEECFDGRFGAAGETGRCRGVPRGTGSLAARIRRRRHRAADGARAGPQACGRRRHRSQHRRHGRLLAGSRRDRAADYARMVEILEMTVREPCSTSGIELPRHPVRRLHSDRRGPEGARVQHALRRSRDAGAPAAARDRPRRGAARAGERRARRVRRRCRGAATWRSPS